jgi:hypothetical protein
MDWETLRNYLASRYTVTSTGVRVIRMDIDVDDGGAPRPVFVGIARTHPITGSVFINIRGWVGPSGEMNPREAFRRSGRLTVGGVVTSPGDPNVWWQHSVRLDDLTSAAIDDFIGLAAQARSGVMSIHV